MRLGSLCSGYGGLDLAVEYVLGAKLTWCADNDPAAARVLAHRWPHAPNLGDITYLDEHRLGQTMLPGLGTDWSALPDVDVITAGYPCQPFSNAGPRRGVDDERNLWPYVAEAIRRARPQLVILENTPGHRGRGFDTVAADLARLGYVGSWRSVRASDVGAPHRRERLFVVATDTQCQRRRPRRRAAVEPRDRSRLGSPTQPRRGDQARPTTDADRPRLEGRQPAEERPTPLGDRGTLTAARGEHTVVEFGAYAAAVDRWAARRHCPPPRPTDPGPTGSERLSPRFVEWLMGLPAGWVTAVPGLDRGDQLRLLGNGVVPHQAVAAIELLLDDLADLDAA